jgi:spore coat polysaccharide biosynthesis protein SpsF
MSSERFPGKVLAPLAGRPVVAHVVERVARAVPLSSVHLLTSTDATDDPLALYAQQLGIDVYRGPLTDVVARFLGCLDAQPCAWFFRICADSPALDERVLIRMQDEAADGIDVLTNTFPRTYPRGQSAELVRAESFRKLAGADLTDEQREHVTKGFYDRPEAWSILNLTSQGTALEPSLAVDVVEDIRRLELAVGS